MSTETVNPIHDLNVLLMHIEISNNLSATLGVKPERLFEDLIVHWRVKYDPGMPAGTIQPHVANMYLNLLKNRLVVSTFHPNVLIHNGFRKMIKPCIEIAEKYGLVIDQFYDKHFYEDGCDCPSCVQSFYESWNGSASSKKLVWDSESTSGIHERSFFVLGGDTRH